MSSGVFLQCCCLELDGSLYHRLSFTLWALVRPCASSYRVDRVDLCCDMHAF